MLKSIFNIYSAVNKATHRFPFLLILVMLLINNPLWALPEPIVSNILANGSIKAKAVLRVTDQKYVFEKSSILATKSVDNTIVFEINEATNVRLPKNFIYTIDLLIESKDVNNKAFPNMNKTMVLNFDSTSSRTALRQVLNLKGRHDLKITVLKTTYTSSTILNVTFTNNTAATVVPPSFNLYASILVNRVMTFACGTKLANVSSRDISFVNGGKADRRQISWRKVINADEYDVEWTFYDAQSAVLRTLLGTTYLDFDFLFKNNVTRITTTDLNYKITLIYPQGRIFYRVRAVHYDVYGQREVTAWTSSGFKKTRLSLFPHQFTVTGHDIDWNWQTQQVFAEEGKQTQSLKYFDASLRERQTQALSNAAKTVVVGETIYDAQGRPVLKVMPAPMPNEAFGYVGGLSKSKMLKPDKLLTLPASVNPNDYEDYSRNDFIKKADDCTTTVDGMKPNISQGAAKYFSPSNPLSNSAENQFTPDAEEHPFSITEFMPDATGRIRRQSGVGKDFKLGSGHETQYFYAKPAQEELDRLFGLDVGPDSSYLKNMVVDGNGQASVSYIDAHGRTIATALAGETTDNLDGLTTLPSGAETIKKDLLNNVAQGESLISSYTLPVHTEGSHTIAYLINTSNLKFDNSCPTPNGQATTPARQVCTTCAYNLDISITSDECSFTPLNFKTPIKLENCNVPLTALPDLIKQWAGLTLKKGTYQITKRLTVNRSELEQKWEAFKADADCIPTRASFIKTAVDALTYEECKGTLTDDDCTTCRTLKFADFSSDYLNRCPKADNQTQPVYDKQVAQAYQETMNRCRANCNDECSILFQNLLFDVSPNGQYGVNYAAGVYSPKANAAIYSTPATGFQDPNIVYLTEEGKPDFVMINEVATIPNRLTLAQFVENWQPSWAQALYEKHPEFCYFDWCNNNGNLFNFEDELVASPYTDFSDMSEEQLKNLGSFTNINDPLWAFLTSAQKVRLNNFTSLDNKTFSLFDLAVFTMYKCNKIPTFIECNTSAAPNLKNGAPSVSAAQISSSMRDAHTDKETLSDGTDKEQNDLTTVDKSKDKTTVNEAVSAARDGVGRCPCTLIKTGCAAEDSLFWVTLRTLYLANRRQLLYEYREALIGNACNINIARIVAPKIRRVFLAKDIPAPPRLPVDVAAQKQKAIANITATYTPVWIGIADAWLDKLKCLNPSADQKTWMKNAFVELLRRTATYQNAALGVNNTFDNYKPNGASSLASTDLAPIKLVINTAGQTENVRSVEAIINTLFPTLNTCSGCDVSLIQTPGLYDAQYNAATLIDEALKPSSTACSNLRNLQFWYDRDMTKHGFTTFFDFFNSMSVVRVSRGEFNIIQNNCSGANRCNVQGNTIALPPQLEDRCKTCEQLAALVTTYNDVCGFKKDRILIELGIGIGAPAPPKGPTPKPVERVTLASATVEMNRLANWLNYQTGMNLDPNEYTWFFNQCRNQTGKTSLFSVASTQLNLLASAYTAAQKVEVTRPPYMICPRPLALAEEFIDSSCYYAVKAQAVNNANIRYDAFIETAKNDFFSRYSRNCLEKARLNEVFTDLGPSKEYHYTLYYYDQAGNLVQTVPPAGVKPLTAAEVENVQAIRKGTVPTASAIPGLVASYPFANNLNDYSGNGLNLTASVGASGIVDGGLKIAGYDAYASAITSVLNESKHTISFYVQFPTINYFGSRKIFNYSSNSSNRDPLISMYPSTTPQLDWRYDPYNTGFVTTTPLSINEWTHVTCTKNAQYLAFYVNGVNVSNSFAYPYTSRGAAPLVFGANDSYGAAILVKDFKAFNRQLTAEEVATLPIKTKPAHALKTQYWYNSLNQVTMQTSPDGGTSLFWYDYLGRLVLSQNEKQFSEAKAGQTSNYSYTLFDNLGRTTEVGQGAWNSSTPPFSASTSDREAYYNNVDGFVKRTAEPRLTTSVNSGTFVKEQVTRTHYDTPPQYVGTIPNFSPTNLRNRVAVVSYVATPNAAATAFDFATHYAYDVAGNVKTLVHNIPELAAEKYAIPISPIDVSLGVGVLTPFADPTDPTDTPVAETAALVPVPIPLLDNRTHRYKRLDYDYDLVSGKVNRLYYQSGEPDQFIYRYDYDADNRLKKALSSTDGLNWSLEAEYKYYKHGPLSRIELGRDFKKVQGMDYAYTLQGWIKGVNASFLDPNRDIGKDGVSGTANANVRKDAFSYTIGYFDGDYKPIGGEAVRFDVKTDDGQAIASASAYAKKGLFNGNIRFIASDNEKFDKPILMTYGYDQLNRLNKMESWQNRVTKANFTWQRSTPETKWREDVSYDANGNIKTYLRRDETGLLMDNLLYNYNINLNNQLNSVTEQVTTPTTYPDDIEAGNNSFVYDKIGNLTTDVKENTIFAWSVYGKMLSATKGSAATTFGYDPQQNRFKKSTPTATDFYIRDAQGNVLAIYQKKDATFVWKEQHLYGSSRLGIWKPEVVIQGIYKLNAAAMEQSTRTYELTNHLGNVLSTITDKGVITSAQDYFPFGLTLASRSFTEGGSVYRYSFNGKEDDKETGFQDYGMRLYFKQLGRFPIVDPITDKYPELTPYQFASNTPIQAIDLDGLEAAGTSTLPQRGGTMRRAQERGQRKASNNTEDYKTMPESRESSPVINGRTSPRYQEDINGKPYLDNSNHSIPQTGEIRSATTPTSAFGMPILPVLESSDYGTDLEQIYEDYYKSLQRPFARPEKDENTVGYTAYITIRDVKKQKDLVKRALVYLGVYSAPRYTSTTIQASNLEVVGGEQWKGKLTKATAYGIEQVLIELNNGGKPSPQLSKTLDNESNGTEPATPVYYSRKIFAVKWLNANIPNWQTIYLRPNVQDNQDARRK